VTFRLLGDPKSHITQQAYQSQYDLLMHIQEAIIQIQRAEQPSRSAAQACLPVILR
jgi:hypothetical protein